MGNAYSESEYSLTIAYDISASTINISLTSETQIKSLNKMTSILV